MMQFELPCAVKAALDRLSAAGYGAYLVGGCVRDDALGVRPHDYDIATSAKPSETHAVFADCKIIDTGLKHGTVTVILGGEQLEITTFRRDGEYRDGRHPESVSFSRALRDDLSRRDFTINAMAYNEQEGLVDLFGGLDDLKNQVIRSVGEAKKRFQEDALRILRALRFAAKLGFTVEESTRSAMDALKGNISLVSRERVAVEITGLLLGKDAARVLNEGKGILFSALPELDAAPWTRAVCMVARAPLKEATRWAALLSPYGEQTAERVMQSLKMSNSLTRQVTTAAKWLDAPLSVDTVAYTLSQIDANQLFMLLDLKRADGMNMQTIQALRDEARRVADSGECVSLKQLAIKGSDLKALSITGAAIGETLTALLREVTLHRLPNEKAALLRAAANGISLCPSDEASDESMK